jgi:uncharacterized SAM-binding protein YcdF (DUF218 family)
VATALARVGVRLLMRPLEIEIDVARGGCQSPADAIVLLGAPLNPDGTLPAITAERARAALTLWREGRAPVICAVGGHCPPGHDDTAIEREGVSRWLRTEGVPESALRVDRLSRSTRGNAERAAQLLLPEGRRRVWLVTQRFHMRRALLLFRRAGFDPIPLRIEAGLLDDEPRWALRRVLREYGSWALLSLRTRARR